MCYALTRQIGSFDLNSGRHEAHFAQDVEHVEHFLGGEKSWGANTGGISVQHLVQR
jgi:hypothetical protein